MSSKKKLDNLRHSNFYARLAQLARAPPLQDGCCKFESYSEHKEQIMSIENAPIVLKLNRSWQPVGFSVVSTALVDLCAGINCFALDIDYPMDPDGQIDFDNPSLMRPVGWDEWITLPIRSWDLVIHSPRLAVRVPTVLVARNYSKMPIHRFKGAPSKRAVFLRDNGQDQYTGLPVSEREASLDHVVPRSRGGGGDWTNVVLASKQINYMKGNRLPEEAGLRLLHAPEVPHPVPVSMLIRTIRHVDWRHFLPHLQH